MSENLFEANPSRRLQGLLAMLENHEVRSPSHQRFVLAGVVTSIDDGTVGDVLEALEDALRKRIKELEK